MTEKVKVSQEVADAIEYLEKVECDFEKAMELHVSTGWSNFSDERVTALDGLTSRELAAALIVGYEVRMTPHEYIAKEYESAKHGRKKAYDTGEKGTALFNRGVIAGIKRTLRAFQITVEGVNDSDDAN